MRTIAVLYLIVYFFLLGWATHKYGWDELAARKARELYRGMVREALDVADQHRARPLRLEGGAADG